MSDQTTASTEDGGCLLPLWAILMLCAVVVGCVIFSIPVFNTLYGIIFPPTPPIPSEANLIERTVLEHGVEETRYSTSQNPCQVVQFFRSQNGTCDVLWDVCEDEIFSPTVRRSFVPFATCQGVTPAGVFAVRWKASIDWLLSPDQTTFLLSHEVLWGGMPMPTSDPSSSDD